MVPLLKDIPTLSILLLLSVGVHACAGPNLPLNKQHLEVQKAVQSGEDK